MHDLDKQGLADQIASYVSEVLHAQIWLEARDTPVFLQVFIGSAYTFFEAHIVGYPCLLMLSGSETDTPSNIAKQVRLVEDATDRIIIVGVSALSARELSRLVNQGIAFVVPGNQFYIPALGMGLREHYRAKRIRSAGRLSPAVQAVLFHHGSL